jgi:hypothetical protein
VAVTVTTPQLVNSLITLNELQLIANLFLAGLVWQLVKEVRRTKP